mgnify:CR=1 FL=1
MDRRSFLLLGAGATASAGLVASRLFDDGSSSRRGPSPSTSSSTAAPTTSTTTRGPVDYGELQAPDQLGLQLARGFSARVVATTGEIVPGTSYAWHSAPDGGACFAAPGGGWVYVSNSESVFGGAGALRFDTKGDVVDAYPILSGTVANCAGGATPWGTWLSCEEHDAGQVWECDPFGRDDPVAHPGMGRFKHEAAACDPDGEVVYLTEDAPAGRLRRFRPDTWGDLSTGVLEAAVVVSEVRVEWTTETDSATPFDGGEGAWYGDGRLWFTTKGDNRVWELDVRARPNTLRVRYDASTAPHPYLSGVDNVVGTPAGDLFVAEDGGNMELVRISRDDTVSPFLRVLGQDGSEVTGPAFSPDGTRLYFSSQRGTSGSGLTYEVRGPFAS